MEKLLCETELLALRAMREEGLPKPVWATWGDWTSPKSLKPIHRQIALMAAYGMSGPTIRERVKISQSRLSILFSSSLMRMEIERSRKMLWAWEVEALKSKIDALATNLDAESA